MSLSAQLLVSILGGGCFQGEGLSICTMLGACARALGFRSTCRQLEGHPETLVQHVCAHGSAYCRVREWIVKLECWMRIVRSSNTCSRRSHGAAQFPWRRTPSASLLRTSTRDAAGCKTPDLRSQICFCFCGFTLRNSHLSWPKLQALNIKVSLVDRRWQREVGVIQQTPAF